MYGNLIQAALSRLIDGQSSLESLERGKSVPGFTHTITQPNARFIQSGAHPLSDADAVRDRIASAMLSQDSVTVGGTGASVGPGHSTADLWLTIDGREYIVTVRGTGRV